MRVYGCAHVSHVRIRRALVCVRFIQIQPGLALVQDKHAWNILNTDGWKNMPRLYPKGQRQNTSLKQDQRYTTTQPEHTQFSVLCKQTHYYGSKKQEEAVPICSTTIICRSIILPLLSLYLRRVWMIHNGYMRKHVVHVPMSRNVTTVWMLTWILNLSL